MFSLSICRYVEEKTQSVPQLLEAQQPLYQQRVSEITKKLVKPFALLANLSQLDYQSAFPKLEIPLAQSHQPSNSLPHDPKRLCLCIKIMQACTLKC